MSTNRNNKVLRYRRRPKAVALILAVVFIYVICFIVMYLSKAKVRTYEVEAGALSANATFTGIAVRSETVYNSQYSGNINYYQREGTRVKSGDTVYSVDQTGRVAQILSQYTTAGENSLSTQSLQSIKTSLNNFRTSYDGSNFSGIYDLKADINSTVLESINENIMTHLGSFVESTGSQNQFRTINADAPGIVVYSVDGYENVSTDNIKPSLFDKSNYSKNNLKTEELVVSNNPAYKLITSEDWYILIPLTQSDISSYDLNNKTSVSIKIKKDDISTTAGFSIINKDGNYYGKLSMDKYMIRYAAERFLDVELVTASNSGLKIPASAVTENEFYSIPKEYLTTGGNSNSYGFICETYDANHQPVTQFVSADIYKSTDTTCYVSKDDFSAGCNIIMPNSSQRYIVGATEKLKGVYCVNTGYTIFKLVDILDQNSEYYIVKKGVSHGISVYDHIVLDADKFSVNQMIY